LNSNQALKRVHNQKYFDTMGSLLDPNGDPVLQISTKEKVVWATTYSKSTYESGGGKMSS